MGQLIRCFEGLAQTSQGAMFIAPPKNELATITRRSSLLAPETLRRQFACIPNPGLLRRLHPKLRQLRCLCCRFDCYRVERTSSRAGIAPTEVQRLFTAYYFASYYSLPKDSTTRQTPSTTLAVLAKSTLSDVSRGV